MLIMVPDIFPFTIRGYQFGLCERINHRHKEDLVNWSNRNWVPFVFEGSETFLINTETINHSKKFFFEIINN